MIWLYGAAGVGKSAVAQTIGEYCRDQGWFGTAFFFSRPANRNDPTRVIPTLVYQLSAANSKYQDRIIQLLSDDRTILEKALRIQFQKLIAEPLFHVHSSTPPTKPVLIILDGLDECKGDAAQREFIKLVGEFTGKANCEGLPLLWMITSRPEWQITSAFAATNPRVQCEKEELLVGTGEAEEDVSRYLRDGFEAIRRKYVGNVISKGVVWPKESQLLAIRAAASGLFVFASTILRFVDDDEVGNPVTQLELCLDFLKGGLVAVGGNPLNPLHMLYSGILRDVRPEDLPIALQILSFNLLTGETLSAQGIANFLGLSQATFYASLRRLYSVIYVPSPQTADWASVTFFHASFEDFVLRVLESGSFGITRRNIVRNVISCCSKWCRKWLETRDIIAKEEDIIGRCILLTFLVHSGLPPSR